MPSNTLVPALAEPREPPLPVRGEIIALGLVAFGLGLRLVHLGSGLWFDEIQTLVDYVRRPLGTVVTTYDSQNQHLLYSVLARISVVLFGESPAALRLPAALLGTGSLWAMYWFARPIVGTRQALLATFLLTVSYHHVWFSQNARGYTGLLLFTLVGTGAFLRLLSGADRPGRSIWLYGIAMALAAYTHITAAFVSLAHLLVLGFLVVRAGPGRRGAARGPALGIALSAALGAVLYAPVLDQLVGTLVGPNVHAARTEWQSPLWLLAETVRGLGAGLPGGWLALLVGAGVMVAGIASLARLSPVLPALCLLPGLLTGAAAVLLGHNLWPRFFFFSAGFAVLIAVRGGFAVLETLIPRRGARVAAVAVIVLAVASALTVPRAWRPKQDYEGSARFIDQSASSNDAVVTVDLTVYPYREYYRRDWAEIGDVRGLEAVEREHSRTWLLYTFPIRLSSVRPDVWSRLQARYDTAAVYPGTVGGGAVVVMVSRDRPGA